MRDIRVIAAFILMLALPAFGNAQSSTAGFHLPPGFEITEYADHTLANDIYCMTVDPKGRIVVSGRGYIRVLIDDKNAGRANRAIEVPNAPKDGAMGLLWEGDTLYVTGDGGIWKYEVRWLDTALDEGRNAGKGSPQNQSGVETAALQKEKPSKELIRAIKTGGEHDAHAISRGPDGWLYVLCGNMAGVDKKFAELPTSPIKEPIAGCVIRFTPDLKKSEIVCHGLRNAYGMDWSQDGDLFTWDSDNERCIGLPWYEGTRFYRIVDGGNYGWLSPQICDFWRLPSYFPDVVPPVKDMGRGSPTGVVCYRHVQFPEEYRGGFFLCDWTFGRIHFAKLKRKGSSYKAETKVFLQATGDNGFAPTAAVVHPDTGDLYVSIGGRGTRGAVYRIRYPKGIKEDLAEEAKKLAPPKLSLDFSPGMRREVIKKFDSKFLAERRWALAMMVRHAGEFGAASMQQAVRANWAEEDHLVREACVWLLRALWQHLDENDKGKLEASASTISERFLLTRALAESDPDRAADIILPYFPIIKDTKVRLEGLRALQLVLGDIGSMEARGTIWEGYTRRREKLPKPIRLLESGANKFGDVAHTVDQFDRLVALEAMRTTALLESKAPGIWPAVPDFLWPYAGDAERDPTKWVGGLTSVARLYGPRHPVATRSNAENVLALDRSLTKNKVQIDHHWSLRIAELFEGMGAKDPKLFKAVLEREEFGRPDHVFFTRAKGFDRKKAASIFLDKIRKDENYPLSTPIIELLGELPVDQVTPLLRERWDKCGEMLAMLPILAKSPEAKDRPKFIDGLGSPQHATVKVCLEALEKLPGKEDGDEVFALIRALDNVADKQKEIRSAIAARLQKITGQDHGADKDAWTRWFAKKYPDKAARLTNPDGVDVEAWNKRLADIDWKKGDVERGQKVFVKASCAACHGGSQSVGPDLTGVTQRFSRADLFTAILQPSRDVPERYRSVRVETKDGKFYEGLVIYEAPDSLILHTGAATTVRIAGENVASRQASPLSPMPAGLLDRLEDGEIADLYEYLRSLRSPAGMKSDLDK